MTATVVHVVGSKLESVVRSVDDQSELKLLNMVEEAGEEFCLQNLSFMSGVDLTERRSVVEVESLTRMEAPNVDEESLQREKMAGGVEADESEGFRSRGRDDELDRLLSDP